MKTHQQKDISYYEIIDDFFNCYDQHDALKLLRALTKWAGKSNWYRKEAPAHLVHFTKELTSLCKVADMAAYSLGRDAAVALELEEGIVQLVDKIVKEALVNTEWKSLPRHLTAGEFLDPYIALVKFSKKMADRSMEEVLADLLDFALGTSTIDGFYTYNELREIKSKLMSLIEACYLMHVRKKRHAGKLKAA